MFSNIRGRHWGVVSRGGICMPLYICLLYVCPPIHLYAFPYPPCTSVCSPSTICSPYVMGTYGGSVHLYVLGSLGGHQYICQAFLCLSVHPFASQFTSNTSCSPLLLVASLLDWVPMDVCYASCYCSFLCNVFIMSHHLSSQW